jgi:hypothetical protein
MSVEIFGEETKGEGMGGEEMGETGKGRKKIIPAA